jgi:small subunit ribosomal protein S21
MLIIDCTKYNSIDQALKVFKNKATKTNLVKELRERQTYLKPSVIRRKEILGAIYRESKANLWNK